MPLYRADVVGSMLRPEYLLRARERHAAGAMPDAEFKGIEDRAVDECIAIQERAGVDVITDGEQRRNVFASQLVQASEGYAAVPGNRVDWFTLDGRVVDDPVTVGLVGKIRRKRHLSAEEFTYLRAKTARPTKVTIPSPTMFAYYWVPGVSEAAYPSTGAYLADVTDMLRDEVVELARLGAEYIQVDAPEIGMLLDPHLRSRIEEASAYVPLERLAISPQCGFASVARGNAVTSDVQEKKLRLIAEVARLVWGA